MSAYTSGVANSICMAKSVTATATDASDGYISVDFDIDVAIVPFVQITTSVGVLQDPNDLVITQPSNGVVKIADGSGDSITEDYVYNIMAIRPKV